MVELELEFSFGFKFVKEGEGGREERKVNKWWDTGVVIKGGMYRVLYCGGEKIVV